MERFANQAADWKVLDDLSDRIAYIKDQQDAAKGPDEEGAIGSVLKALRNFVLNGGARLSVINKSGSTIKACKGVSISGYDTATGCFKIVPADNSTWLPVEGVTTEDVVNNAQSTVCRDFLYVVPDTTNGIGLDTSGATVGDKAYLGTAGAFTLTEPDKTLYLDQVVGYVDRKSVKQVQTLTISAAFAADASVTLYVGTTKIGPVAYNATSDQTLADLATAIAAVTGIQSATVTAVGGGTSNDRLITVTTSALYKLTLGTFVDGSATPVTAALAETTAAVFGDLRFKVDALTSPAALKAYIDAAKTTAAFKDTVQYVATANTGRTGNGVPGGGNTQAIPAGKRVLCAGETSSVNNGIYVSAAGAWTRATDFDQSTEVKSGYCVPVDATDATQPDSVWIITSASGVVGTDPITFQRITFLSFGGDGDISTQAAGDAAAGGTSTKAARADHKHAMPAADPAAGTAGFRTLGNGAQQACAGNDARLSDTRTPTDGTASGIKQAVELAGAPLADARASATSLSAAFATKYTIPANRLKIGSMVRVRLGGAVTAQGGADTLALTLRIGGQTVLVTTALAVAIGDGFFIDATIIFTAIGAAGVAKWNGCAHSQVGNSTTLKDNVASVNQNAAVDSTAGMDVDLLAVWGSSTAGGSSARLDVLDVQVIN